MAYILSESGQKWHGPYGINGLRYAHVSALWVTISVVNLTEQSEN